MERYESWIDRAKSSYEYSKAIVNKYVYKECIKWVEEVIMIKEKNEVL